MKKYNKNFVYTEEFIKESIVDCLHGKWSRNDVSFFFCDYLIEYAHEHGSNEKFTNQRICKMNNRVHNFISNQDNRMKINRILDFIAHKLYLEIENRCIELEPIEYFERYDPNSKKTRVIGNSTIKQQIYDYIAVNSCMKMFMNKIGTYQCASIKGRGQSYGKRTLEKWLRNDVKHTKYAFKCDIKKYYPNVNQDLLRGKLYRDIDNDAILYVLYTLIDTYDSGLCIGSYLSQFLANYYLSYAYHYLSENVYKIRKTKNDGEKRSRLCYHILFYMDDILILGSNKRDLRKCATMLEKYLNEKLDLHLKDNKQFFKIKENTFIDMMGFKVYRTHTELRKSIFLKGRKLFIKYKNQERNITLHDARVLMSYKGFFEQTDCFKFQQKYKYFRTIKKAKGVIKNAS